MSSTQIETRLLGLALFTLAACSRDAATSASVPSEELPQAPLRSSEAPARAPVELVTPAPEPAAAESSQRSTGTSKYSRLDIPLKGGEPDLSRVTLTLERTGSSSWYPAYSVTIHGDGRAQYVGNADVLIKGAHAFKANVTSIQRLLARLDALDFFAMSCESNATVIDAPHAFVTLEVGDRKRRIENPFTSGKFLEDMKEQEAACFQDLNTLATEIDIEVEIEKWIGKLDDRRARFAEKR